MTAQERILVTGGSGLLGGELRRLLPRARFPTSSEFDVTDLAGMRAWVESDPPELLLHAAAFTSPPRVEQEPGRAIDANIVGTANVVKLCMQLEARLVYVSTDYVFRGDRGHYSEEDPVHPVNRYAWSKLGGECAARLYDRALIVRTSFGPNAFPYPKAFVDQWTSRESVAEIARKLVRVLVLDLAGVLHIGGPRRTVYEYATSLHTGKEIGELSVDEVDFQAPRDTSLNCERFRQLVGATDGAN